MKKPIYQMILYFSKPLPEIGLTASIKGRTIPELELRLEWYKRKMVERDLTASVELIKDNKIVKNFKI